MTITAEKIEIYREGLRRRLSRPLTELEQDELAKAYIEAKHLAQKLLKEYGGKRILLFGSVARRRPLRANSDIDLAVEGMSPEIYYRIIGDLQTDSGRMVDLVRLESVRPPIKHVILTEGIVLAGDS